MGAGGSCGVLSIGEATLGSITYAAFTAMIMNVNQAAFSFADYSPCPTGFDIIQGSQSTGTTIIQSSTNFGADNCFTGYSTTALINGFVITPSTMLVDNAGISLLDTCHNTSLVVKYDPSSSATMPMYLITDGTLTAPISLSFTGGTELIPCDPPLTMFNPPLANLSCPTSSSSSSSSSMFSSSSSSVLANSSSSSVAPSITSSSLTSTTSTSVVITPSSSNTIASSITPSSSFNFGNSTSSAPITITPPPSSVVPSTSLSGGVTQDPAKTSLVTVTSTVTQTIQIGITVNIVISVIIIIRGDSSQLVPFVYLVDGSPTTVTVGVPVTAITKTISVLGKYTPPTVYTQYQAMIAVPTTVYTTVGGVTQTIVTSSIVLAQNTVPAGAAVVQTIVGPPLTATVVATNTAAGVVAAAGAATVVTATNAAGLPVVQQQSDATVQRVSTLLLAALAVILAA